MHEDDKKLLDMLEDRWTKDDDARFEAEYSWAQAELAAVRRLLKGRLSRPVLVNMLDELGAFCVSHPTMAERVSRAAHGLAPAGMPRHGRD